MRVKKRQSRYRHLWFSVWTQESRHASRIRFSIDEVKAIQQVKLLAHAWYFFRGFATMKEKPGVVYVLGTY